MSDVNVLLQVCEKLEKMFSDYHFTFCNDLDGVNSSVEVRSKTDVFTDIFLRLLFDELKEWLMFLKCDKDGRPIVKILVKYNRTDL